MLFFLFLMHRGIPSGLVGPPSLLITRCLTASPYSKSEEGNVFFSTGFVSNFCIRLPGMHETRGGGTFALFLSAVVTQVLWTLRDDEEKGGENGNSRRETTQSRTPFYAPPLNLYMKMTIALSKELFYRSDNSLATLSFYLASGYCKYAYCT